MADIAVAVGVARLSSNERVQGGWLCPGVVRIEYKRRALAGSSSLDAAPVNGSLLFYAPVCCLAEGCAAEMSSWVLFGCTDCSLLAVCGLYLRQISVTGRRPGAAVVRVLQGRDARSMRPLVLERGFHDVNIVDMGDLTVGVYGRVVSSSPAMAGNGAPTYGLAATGPGYDACRGQ